MYIIPNILNQSAMVENTITTNQNIHNSIQKLVYQAFLVSFIFEYYYKYAETSFWRDTKFPLRERP